MADCIFCSKLQTEILGENQLAKAFFDKYPVNQGHVLIVPKRHVETLFDATFEELAAINSLMFEMKELLDGRYKPDGYNVGVNVGSSGGQTVFHLHYHLIPRYQGDVPDPREGVCKLKNRVTPYVNEGEGN